MMRTKISGFLICFLPLLISFNYVIDGKQIQQVYASNYDSNLYQHFFFNVITSAIAQLFWLITIFLIWKGALKQLHTWRVLTTLLILEQILIYGLAVEMSFILSHNLALRNSGIWNQTIEYYIVWGAVCVGCLWFVFLVFLFLIIGHVYQKEHLKPIVVDEVSKVY